MTAPHPGTFVRQIIQMNFCNTSATARAIKFDRSTLVQVTQCKAPVTRDLSLKLGAYFGDDAATFLIAAIRAYEDEQTLAAIAKYRETIAPRDAIGVPLLPVADDVETLALPAPVEAPKAPVEAPAATTLDDVKRSDLLAMLRAQDKALGAPRITAGLLTGATARKLVDRLILYARLGMPIPQGLTLHSENGMFLLNGLDIYYHGEGVLPFAIWYAINMNDPWATAFHDELSDPTKMKMILRTLDLLNERDGFDANAPEGYAVEDLPRILDEARVHGMLSRTH